MWKVKEDPGEVHSCVEDAREVHTRVEGCGRLWNGENDLESSIVDL